MAWRDTHPSGRFLQISRPVVSKHLRILREARLVGEAADGRERWYHLNPQPLREMYEGWPRYYEALWSERQQMLKRIVEADEHRRKPARKG